MALVLPLSKAIHTGFLRLYWSGNCESAIAQESAATAVEMRQLMDAIATVMAGGDELESLVSGLVQTETAAFMQMVILILILFVALIGYRYISVRFIPQ